MVGPRPKNAAMNKARAKHGMSGTRLYKVWAGMCERCHNQNHSGYGTYGGRGIYVCEAWKEDFSAFLRDMGERPPGASLDRINNDGPYSPDNCRWATSTEQGRNKRNNRLLTCFGETKPVSAWADDARCRVNEQSIKNRIFRGWTAERAITTPAHWRGQKPVPTQHKEPA
jgi:hypothetical protein